MSDERMDARLRRAGEAWRTDTDASALAVTEAAAPVEPLTVTEPARPKTGRRLGIITSAGLVAAALVTAGIALVANIGGGSKRPVATEGSTLDGGSVWRLLGYNDDELLTKSDAALYIGKDGTLIADDGCVLLATRADLDGGRIRLTGTSAPRFYSCVDSSIPNFNRGLDILRAAPTYSIDGDDLTITSDGQTMHLRAAPEFPTLTADVPTFVGAQWRLTGVKDANGHDMQISGSPMLTIDDTGHLNTSDTCNSLSGDITIDGSTADAKGLAMTEIGCPANVMATAAVIDAFFSGAFTWQVNGPQLTLSRDGAGTLVYQWVPADSVATDPANLTGRTWHLASIAGQPVAGKPTLRIAADGTVSGSNGCQPLAGSADIAAGWFRTTGLPDSPPASCDDADDATTMDSFLTSNPVRWSIRDGKLLIYGGGSQAFSLVFTSADSTPTPPGLAPLVGNDWTLNGIVTDSGNSGDGTASSAMTDVKVRLDGAGHMTITHRCYVNKADVQIGDDTLQIGDVTLDRAVPCPATQNQQEEQRYDASVDDVLSGNVSWSIQHGTLQISKGDTTLQFLN